MELATVGQIAFEAEIEAVRLLAAWRDWSFERPSQKTFRVAIPAKDGQVYHLEVECEGYGVRPPAFHWRNPTTGLLDEPCSMPAEGGYFHQSGRICAPWNRLASMAGGPHLDWVDSDWRENPRTGATRTLAAMLIRIRHELWGSNYRGRRA